MAEALGVAQFYTGFVCSASREERDRFSELLGLNGDTIHAGMALGMPKFKFEKYIDKKEITVNYL